jgi:hypothetical protein
MYEERCRGFNLLGFVVYGNIKLLSPLKHFHQPYDSDELQYLVAYSLSSGDPSFKKSAELKVHLYQECFSIVAMPFIRDRQKPGGQAAMAPNTETAPISGKAVSMTE